MQHQSHAIVVLLEHGEFVPESEMVLGRGDMQMRRHRQQGCTWERWYVNGGGNEPGTETQNVGALSPQSDPWHLL